MSSVLKMSAVTSLALAMFLVASSAMAVSISNPLFSNGQTSIDATGGSTVNGTFTLTVGAGEVVEFFRTQSDPSQPFVDASVGGTLGYQEQVYSGVPFSVKVNPNTGTYTPTVQMAGIFGGARSINGGDGVVFGPSGLGTVRVVSGSVTNSEVGGTNLNLEELKAWILALIQGTQPAPAPVVKAECKALSDKMVGTVQGSTAQGNVRLQGFLLAEGMSIPALEQGAAFGFYGPQTMSAVGVYKSIHGCN